MIDHDEPPAGGYIALKTVVASMPIPTYRGNNDLEIFMKWLQAFLNYLDIHQLVGKKYDHHWVITMRAAMKGSAQAWFDMTIRCGAPNNTEDRITFIQAVFKMADAFISPATATWAQQRFDQIMYSRQKGILSYVWELQMVSYHILLLVDKYLLRKQIIQAIPSSIRNMLIDYKGLSVSTSSHSMEVMVYQYDKLFGYVCWMTGIPTIIHIFVFLGYSEFPSWLAWQPIQILRYPKIIQQNIPN